MEMVKGKDNEEGSFFKPVVQWILSKHRHFDNCRACYRPPSVGLPNAAFQNGQLRDFETTRFPTK